MRFEGVFWSCRAWCDTAALRSCTTETASNVCKRTLNIEISLHAQTPEAAGQWRAACSYLVVDVTVGEHGVEVLHGLTGAPVVIVLKTFLNSSHVHRVLDHLVVVLETWK